MSTLSTLPNVGKVLESYLLQIGIDTPEQLRVEERKRFLFASVSRLTLMHVCICFMEYKEQSKECQTNSCPTRRKTN